MPFPLPFDMSKDFCIIPLIKITIQSKALFQKGLYCATVPNTAFERQILPYIAKQVNHLLYLLYGFNAGSKKCS